jgi:uncharacterized damage-inducible protein DinB
MRIKLMAGCWVLSLCALTATAQMPMGDTKKGPPAGTVMEPSKAVDSQLNIIEGEMMGAVKAMPEEKFGFAPSSAIFVAGQKTEFTSVRTFAEQAKHVAQANYFFMSAAGGMKPDTDVEAIGKLTKKDDIVAALAGSFAFGHKVIATLTPANAFEVVNVQEIGVQTRTTLSMFVVAHAFDHYGQMVEYLRMNGIVPPASAK